MKARATASVNVLARRTPAAPSPPGASALGAEEGRSSRSKSSKKIPPVPLHVCVYVCVYE